MVTINTYILYVIVISWKKECYCNVTRKLLLIKKSENCTYYSIHVLHVLLITLPLHVLSIIILYYSIAAPGCLTSHGMSYVVLMIWRGLRALGLGLLLRLTTGRRYTIVLSLTMSPSPGTGADAWKCSNSC